MSATPLLLSLFLALPLAPDDLPRSSIPAKDLGKLSKGIQAAFDALLADDLSAEQKALDTIEKEFEKLAKRAKLTSPLANVGDWDIAFELAKPEVREFKSNVGKGFFRYTFVDDLGTKSEDDDTLAGCLLSLPAAYGKDESLLPVVVALKPPLGLSGSDLDAKVTEMASTAYAGLLETHIVLIPLGMDTRQGRGFESHEVDGSWMAGDNLVPLFTSFRVLLEQVRFDRARVVLDGWGDAGLDAVRVATSFPSWFAGVINRSGDVGGEYVIYSNLGEAALLYVAGASDGREVDLAPLKELGDSPAVTVLEDEGSSLAPGEETQKAIVAWVGERKRDLAPASIDYKLGDIRFQCVGWLKATDPRVRASAKPSDPDYPQMKATIDRASNTIKIDTVNVLELSIFLSDALVDMDKPVKVVINGEERVNRQFVRELRTMIENRFFVDDGFCGVYTAKTTVGEIPPNIPEKSP